MPSPETLKYESRNPFKIFFIKRFKEEIANLGKLIQPYRVLDAGCGEGYLLDFLGTRFKEWRIEGFDISSQAVGRAKAKVPAASLSVRDIYDTQYPDKSFDLVINTEVLEHLREPEKVLMEIKRLARRWVILSVPNEPLFSLSNFLMLKDIMVLGNNRDHVNRWNEADFVKLIKKYFMIIRLVRPFPWLLLLCEIAPEAIKNEEG